MAFIFDYLSAMLISVTVFMVLVGTHFSLQQAGIEQVSAHAAKTKSLSLGQWLEDDITSLGANFGRNLYRFEVPETDVHGVTTRWVFYSDSLQADGQVLRHLTRYRADIVDEITLRSGETKPLYQVRRQTATSPVVDNDLMPISDSQWRDDGLSVGTLSNFRIQLADRGGALTDDVVRADFIRVEFAMVPEFERHRGYLQELYWATMLKVRPFWHQPTS